ncbi:hypothetical protein, partial [Streptomyces sp. S3(2020)]|uniref:hypothetical protein n=1 Tax=Streptomyces sp. S3(2020) TaxID=2732044 RepID=UPI0019CFC33D
MGDGIPYPGRAHASQQKNGPERDGRGRGRRLHDRRTGGGDPFLGRSDLPLIHLSAPTRLLSHSSALSC